MVHEEIAIINLIISIIILGLLGYTISRLKSVKHMLHISIAFAIVAILFVVHAGIEVLELSEIYYAITALIATLILGYTIYLLYKNSPLNVKLGDQNG